MNEQGLNWALEQLQRVQNASNGALKIVSVDEKGFYSISPAVELSIETKHLKHRAPGIKLRERERIFLAIPDDFPFYHPTAFVKHYRFAGLTHVQWKRHICLYQSPSTEWNPADGIFGCLERIDEWLLKASTGTLVEAEGPIHPPIAYISSRLGGSSVVIKANAPEVNGEPWLGIARMSIKHECRTDIVGWIGQNESTEIKDDEIAGAAVLLHTSMPFEYPSNFQDLLSNLNSGGVSTKDLLICLAIAARKNNANYPLYVAIGTPMRRMPGETFLRQHLLVWYLQPSIAATFQQLFDILSDGETEAINNYIHGLETGEKVQIEWCRVLEGRDEVTIRRDETTPMSWFRDKSVTVLGAGALGSHVCEMLVRAGVAKLIIHDNKIVNPGVLTRQPYIEADIGKPKVLALKERLKKIRSSVTIETANADILKEPLGLSDWTEKADVIIDATANVSVLAKLEAVRMNKDVKPIPIISMVIGPSAERGLIVLAGREYSGSVSDVSRKAKISATQNKGLSNHINDFWNNKSQTKPFQPEPGCSESTFIGSAADVITLAGMMLNLAARDLATLSTSEASAHFVSQPWLNTDENIAGHYKWGKDFVIPAQKNGYEVRIEAGAIDSMHGWINQSGNTSSITNETGGVMFGEINNACRIAWITEMIGPPSDSTASPAEFICGIDGVEDANKSKQEESRNSIYFLGLWHTHPNSVAIPSTMDLNGVLQILSEKESGPSRVLMLIAAGKNGNSQIGCGVFKKGTDISQWTVVN